MEFQKNQLNDLVKEIRLSLGLNQKQFAQKCQLSGFQLVSNIETKQVKIGLNMLDKICKACNIDYSINLKIEERWKKN